MKKEFHYVSKISNFLLILVFLSVIVMSAMLASIKYHYEENMFLRLGLPFLLMLLMVWLYKASCDVKGRFQADDTAFEFQFLFGSLHLDYDKLKNCQLVSRPRHNRYGNLTGYEIDLKIIDSYQNVHHIRQRLAAEHTSEVYPLPIPEEVENSELTEIRDFIKSKLKTNDML